jgi:hypothetical protein
VLTLDRVLDLADRHQRDALRDVAAYASAIGEPVAFLVRRGPAGLAFEAVALGSARTCAVVDEEGGLRYVAGARVRDPWQRATRPGAAAGAHTGSRRVAERALEAAARPRS